MAEQDPATVPTEGESVADWLKRTSGTAPTFQAQPPSTTLNPSLPKDGESVGDWYSRVNDSPVPAGGSIFSKMATNIAPERAKRILDVQSRISPLAPPDFIDRNLDQGLNLEQKVKQADFNRDVFLNTDPELAKWISQSPQMASFVGTDPEELARLGKLKILLQRPPVLWPMSEQAIQQQARRLAQIKASDAWASAGGKPRDRNLFPSGEFGESLADPFYASSQKEMEEMYYTRELEQLHTEENFIRGTDQQGFLETGRRTFQENPAFFAPAAAHIAPLFKTIDEALTKNAYQKGTANELEKDAFLRIQRLEAVAQMRGKSVLGMLTEQGMNLPATLGEMGGGLALGKSIVGDTAKTMGMRLLQRVGASAIAAGTAGAPQIAENFINQNTAKAFMGLNDKGEYEFKAQAADGRSAPIKLLKSSWDVFADYLGAELMGPWWAKATPEAQQLVKVSLLKAIPLESVKMIAMGQTSEALKGQIPSIVEAFKNPEVAKQLLVQGGIGGIFGAVGAFERNAQVRRGEAAIKEFHAKLTSEMLEALGDTTSESKVYNETPAVAQDFSEKFSKDGPHEFVYAPFNVWSKYWESKGQDPREVARGVGVDPAHYDEARRLTSDIQIPMAEYLTKLAPTEARTPKDVAKAVTEAPNVFAKEFKIDPNIPSLTQAQEQTKATQQGQPLQPEEFLKQAGTPTEDLWNLGLKGEKAEKYQKAISAAEGESLQKVANAEIEKRRAAQESEKEELRKQVRPQIEEIVNSSKEQQALKKLKEAGAEGKISEKLAAEMYGEQFGGIERSKFPSGIFDEGGIHPDDLAGPLGFSSGKELLQSLQGLKDFDKKAHVDQNTELTIRDMRPDLYQEPTLSDIDVMKLQGENASKLLKMQLDHFLTEDYAKFKGLVKALDRKPVSLESTRKQAVADVMGKTLRATKPDVYKNAMEAAKSEALDNLLKGNFEGMYDARQKQLEALEHYRAALEAQKLAGQVYDFMRKARSLEYRQMLGKAGEDYLPQFEDIANRFEFSNSPRNEASRQVLRDFVSEKQKNGESNLQNVAAPEWLLNETNKVNYKDLTNQQLAELHDSLTQLDTMARTKNAFFAADAKEAWEGIKSKILESIVGSKEKLPLMPEKDAQRFQDKLMNLIREMHASLIKPEEFLRELGNNDIASPLMEYFFHPLAESESAMRTMQKKISAAFLKAYSEMPESDLNRLHERVIFKTPAGDRIMTRKNLLMMAGNAMNDSNMGKMVKGESLRLRGDGLTEAQIRDALDTLTKGEIDFMNKAVKIVGSLWPELKQLHIDMTGLPPEEIQGRPMELKNGTLEGGYWPVIYSGDSMQGERQQEARLGEVTSSNFRRATMGIGSRASRIEDFARPMDFDFDNLASILTANISDITHRRWMLDANKILWDKDISGSIEERYGKDILGRLREMTKEAVNDRNQANLQSLGWARQMINGFRQAYAMTATGFKIVTLLEHATSFATALDPTLLGPSYLGRGFDKFFNGAKGSYNEAVDKGSTVIPHLIETANRDIKEALEQASQNFMPTSLFQKIKNGSTQMAARAIGLANMSRALPIWWGSYYKALETLPQSHGFVGTELEKNAIRTADQNVRLIVGSSGAKDLSAVQAGSKYGEISKLFTMFYTQGSLLYSRASGIAHDFGKTKNWQAATVSTLLAFPLAATIQALVRGEFPRDDKDETWAGWWAKSNLSYAASPLPFVRDGVNLALYQRDSSPLSPGSDVAKSLMTAFETVEKVGEGDATATEALEKAYNAANYWMGLPTDQLQTWLDYMKDLNEGETDQPDDIFQFYHNVLHYHHRVKR